MHDKAISDIFMPLQTALHFHTIVYQHKWVNTNNLYVLQGGKANSSILKDNTLNVTEMSQICQKLTRVMLE